jgi:hypothetical protein
VRLRGGLVVAVLRGWTHTIPGLDTQRLLLFGGDGRLLDRLTVGHSGTFPEAEADGTQLVIRYIPPQGQGMVGNWSHEIRHGERAGTFGWGPDELARTPWDVNRLCRVTVHAVLFPKLGD